MAFAAQFLASAGGILHMTIITITPKGTIKLPAEIIKHLRSAKHLQVRENAHGITLTPVAIQRANDLHDVPDRKGGKVG